MRMLMGVVVLASVTVAQADDLVGPTPEVQRSAIKVKLPAIPSFAVPADEPGVVSVHTLRVDGEKRLGTKVRVKGYVTWVYDCVAANAKRGESRARTQKRIDNDQTLCERMKFYLGATRNEAKERGLWIVEVPRPPTKLERERLPEEELALWPVIPKYKRGDLVVVTGKFARASPSNERNSDGLVVFSALEPARKAPPAKLAAPPPRPAIPALQTKQVSAPPKDGAARERSIKAANAGTRLYGQRNYTDAAAAYKQAVAAWPGNHVAYYGLAGCYIGQRDWKNARDAMKHAHELEPQLAMYAMVYGYTTYEAAIAEARLAQARKQNVPPEQATFDRSAVNHDHALVILAHALTREPGLWRAHMFIGRIYRDRGDARWAAEAFDAALRSAPADSSPWLDLTALYRRWGYTDAAIAVAKAGTSVVTGAEASDVWYVLGMGYDDKRRTADAIRAYTKALEAKPDHAQAHFQRGKAWFETKAYAKAKADLEAFMAAPGPDLEFPKLQAKRMLMNIAAK